MSEIPPYPLADPPLYSTSWLTDQRDWWRARALELQRLNCIADHVWESEDSALLQAVNAAIEDAIK